MDLFESILAYRDKTGQLDAVFVDEAQFLSHDQVWQLARVGDELGIPVLCYGLRTDFQGKLFDGSAALLAIADDLREARTICHCGRKATMSLRLDESGGAVSEGQQVRVSKDVYVSVCRKHWLEGHNGRLNSNEVSGSEVADMADLETVDETDF
jgi:thymidine kinase